MRRWTKVAAAVMVGVMGGGTIASGDDHIRGPLEDCFFVPWWCQGECAELNACRSGNTPIGGDCDTEERNLRACEISSPPLGGPQPPIIIVPPPSCPAGEHLHAGACHADHRCGPNAIGGGSKDCVECGDDFEPNEDKTECVSDYREALCSRPLASAPSELAKYLPYHENVSVEDLTDGLGNLERGFFALDMAEAVEYAGYYALFGILLFTEGKVLKDDDLGDCDYEYVSYSRYKTVWDRMWHYKWQDYHLLVTKYSSDGYGSCITWATTVRMP